MEVDPLILFTIYLIAVTSLVISLYALVVLIEVRDYYRAVYNNIRAAQKTTTTRKPAVRR